MGLKVVTIGGGTGHFTLLSGLKKHPVDITAVVTMADDGGSTGVLRDELGVLPPGDLRQCLVALSEEDAVLRKLFAYRFDTGGLKGHTFGNLFISTLEKVTGSLEAALLESHKLLAVHGTVLPVTLSKVRLEMELKNGKVLTGEDAIDHYTLISRFGIKKLSLAPKPTLYKKVKSALCEADLIVLGPGDFYTSILPSLLVPGFARALARAKAPKVFVANLMNRHGVTDDFTCATYVRELERFAGVRFVDAVLFNTTPIPAGLLKKYVDEGEPVDCGDAPAGRRWVGRDLLSATLDKPKQGDPLRRTLIRHDQDKLARALLELTK